MLSEPALDQSFSQPSLSQCPMQDTDAFYTASKSGPIQAAALDMYLGWGDPEPCLYTALAS
jgi:hypothetical protein